MDTINPGSWGVVLQETETDDDIGAFFEHTTSVSHTVTVNTKMEVGSHRIVGESSPTMHPSVKVGSPVLGAKRLVSASNLIASTFIEADVEVGKVLVTDAQLKLSKPKSWSRTLMYLAQVHEYFNPGLSSGEYDDDASRKNWTSFARLTLRSPPDSFATGGLARVFICTDALAEAVP
jgi:hypothetical protein